MNQEATRSPRFHELDSMRGIAAIIVVFHHYCQMFYPQIINGNGLAAILLHPLVSGRESVMLFFVLSGFVLSLPFLRGVNQPYPLFLSRRVLRIYGPYLGALALSLAGCAVWHNQFGTTGWASGTWYQQVDLRSVVQHVLFIGRYNDQQYNTAFWSLVHEMRISIIFPLLFLLVNRTRRSLVFLVIILCELAGNIHHYQQGMYTIQYAGIFMLGILLAKHLDSIHQWFCARSFMQRALFALFVLALYLGGSHASANMGSIVISLGAAGLMIFALNSTVVRNALLHRTPSFLGKISYSLYLVHGTVLFAMTAMLKNRISHLSFFLIYVPLSILLSWIFFKLVEAPFTTMSRNVGKKRVTLIPVATASTD
ncbi:acyltransferase [Edaphobacter acidisoli]|uniref:Acyltransferase n=1 Tax=Edaphobacter acidisoli TaxID=2040573 RepID=A0A916RN29_9BACT|nr:acyltransferase [Edaphobacter acidisoli]